MSSSAPLWVLSDKYGGLILFFAPPLHVQDTQISVQGGVSFKASLLAVLQLASESPNAA